MRSDKLTHKSQEALTSAQQLATDNGQQEVDLEHLLLAMVQQKDGVVPAIVSKVGADKNQLHQAMADELQRRPRVSGGRVYVSDRLSKTVDAALKEAGKL